VLKVAMDIEDKHVKISGKEKTLRKARGISFFVTYISKLESLEEFEIVGRDKVYEVVNNELVPVLVDINDPRAIGPWFKAMIENERKQRERADWKEINKKRIEKEFRELEEKEAATKLKKQQDRQQLIARWTGVPRPFAS
jgi:hypothetical protein